jgi:hypothetical protein
MARCSSTLGELRRVARARRHDPRHEIARHHHTIQRVDPARQRLVDECVAVHVERIEEERTDRQRRL